MTIPQTMTAIEIEPFGPPEGLKPCERPVPSPAAGEVLIKVAYAGVNRPDVIQRLGNYAPPPGVTDIPGLEVSGEIVAVGEGVEDWSVGDKCCALAAGGGYAEYCTAPAPQCLPIPSGFSMEEAAAVPETYFTVWTNVFDRGHLKSGETILIHGGSSGIGTTAIQLAKAFDAKVYVTAGSADKCAACEALGADKAINYREEDFGAVMKEAGGADLVLDMVGGEYIEKNLDLLKVDGRMVFIAFLNGPVVEKFNFLKVMLKRLTISGSTLRPRSIGDKGLIAQALREKVWPLLEGGSVRPQMYKTFDFKEASDAHALMESSTHIGKIMLKVSG